MILREGQVSQPVRRLNDGGRQAHLDMPFNVAMEQPSARVGGLEPQDGVRVRHDRDGVAPGRLLVVVGVPAGPVPGAGLGAVENLEVMAVEMERVGGSILVVDHDLDDIAVVDNEGVDLAVDDGIAVVVARGGGRVQGRHLLVDVCQVVEASAGVAVGICAECEVHLDQSVIVGVVPPEDRLVVIWLEVRVVSRLPLVHHVLLGVWFVVIHGEVAGVVVWPLEGTQVGICPVTVDIQRDQEWVVVVVSINALDDEVVTLSRGNAELILDLLLQIVGVIHNDVNVVRIEVNHGGSQGGEADHAEAILPAFGEVDIQPSSLVDDHAIGNGRSESSIARLQHVADHGKRLIVVPVTC